MQNKYDVIVIGGGPAGMAAALAASKQGAKVLILERDYRLGGILNQCIHNGFGLHYFKTELTGPEYAYRFRSEVEKDRNVEVVLEAMVLSVTPDKKVTAICPSRGLFTAEGGAVVLAMGCRERTAGAIQMPGSRPAGIYTAGMAQRIMNIEGYKVGKKVVILGSGDIGLIMARRMTLEGAEVKAVVELMPYSNGLKRNIAQCLDDYGIPLYLSHTVTDIIGENGRLSKVIVSKVNGYDPIPGTEIEFDVDTLLLSVGLVPENELTRNAGIEIDKRTNGAVVDENNMTSVEGIFSCGNVLHVHDLVDFVTHESERAGKAAAEYLKAKAEHREESAEKPINLINGEFIGYTVPQKVTVSKVDKFIEVLFRVRAVLNNVNVVVKAGDTVLMSKAHEQMLPAEMEKLIIPKKMLEMANGKDITIGIEKIEKEGE